jgi:hypothetical protein
MYTQSEYDRLIQEFRIEQNEKRQKLKKIWGILLVVTILLIGLLIIIFPNQFSNGETAWILPSYGGMAFVATLIGFLVSINYTSEKPFFTYLFPEIYEKINLDEGLYLEYSSYEKSDKEFVKQGGLFTRGASVKIRRHVRGHTEDQLPFDIYDCTLTTSNGKNQQVHFDGVYMVLHKQLFSSLQIRTHGNPKLKGVKFHRMEDITPLRVFKEEEQNMSNIDHIVLRYIQTLYQDENIKRLHCSIVDGFVHLAITYRKHPARKQSTINLSTLNKFLDHFNEELRIIEEVATLENY